VLHRVDDNGCKEVRLELGLNSKHPSWVKRVEFGITLAISALCESSIRRGTF